MAMGSLMTSNITNSSSLTHRLPYLRFLLPRPKANPITRAAQRTQSQYRTPANPALPSLRFLMAPAWAVIPSISRSSALPPRLRVSASNSRLQPPSTQTVQREIPPYTLSLRPSAHSHIQLKTQRNPSSTQLFTVSSLQFAAAPLKFFGTGESSPRSRDTVAVRQRLPEKRGNPC